MTRNLLLVIAGLLAAILVTIVVVKPQSRVASVPVHEVAPAPPMTAAPAAPAQAAAPLVAADPSAGGGLAKNSSDQTFVQFVANFRTSSLKACTDSLNAALKTANPAALQKVSTVCGCATDRVVDTITVDEARAASVSAFAGDVATNPTIQSFKTRFADAGKACMAESLR